MNASLLITTSWLRAFKSFCDCGEKIKIKRIKICQKEFVICGMEWNAGKRRSGSSIHSSGWKLEQLSYIMLFSFSLSRTFHDSYDDRPSIHPSIRPFGLPAFEWVSEWRTCFPLTYSFIKPNKLKAKQPFYTFWHTLWSKSYHFRMFN